MHVHKILALAMRGSKDQARSLLVLYQNVEEVKKDLHYLQGICELYDGNT